MNTKQLIRDILDYKGDAILPPIRVERWGTANNPGSQTILFAFQSGRMATAIELPASHVKDICEALMHSANRAAEN